MNGLEILSALCPLQELKWVKGEIRNFDHKTISNGFYFFISVLPLAPQLTLSLEEREVPPPHPNT